MTQNQRRPGFRLPWASEADAPPADGEPEGEPQAAAPAGITADAANAAVPAASDAAASAEAVAEGVASADAANGAAAVDAMTPEAEVTDTSVSAAPEAAPTAGDDFMRDLVSAMRGVADEARETGLAELRAKSDEQVRTLETDAEGRREALRAKAESDVVDIGKWAEAETSRIKHEAEQKVAARRAQLDQELAADRDRTEADTKAVRERVTTYERELEAYHAQLAQINDPAAFAAAAKRLPKPPALDVPATPAATPRPAPAVEAKAPDALAPLPPVAEAAAADESVASRLAALGSPAPEAPAVTEAATPAADPAAATAAQPAAAPAHAETAAPAAAAPEAAASEAVAAEASVPQAVASEVAAPEAEASSKQPAQTPAAEAPPAPAETPAAAAAEQVVTEVVVKGLGSFGAITGFRQSLSNVDGVESVALSLGQTGEFVFRATHAANFDIRAAIAALEGDGAKIEGRPEGGLRVTLERAR